MRLRKQTAIRIAVGLLLVILAAGVSYIIRDLLASRNPISALPILHVQYYDEDTEIPAEYCMLASYSWRLVNKTAEWEQNDPEAWRGMEPFPASPNAPLSIGFSFPCKSMKVSRWYTGKEGDAEAEVLTGPLTTPYSGGTYTYRIEAEWGSRGSVQYYFRVKVQ